MAAERLANVPLGPLTTMGVGGPARWLWRWRDAEEVCAGLAFARSENLPWWVLGGGSNVRTVNAPITVIGNQDAAENIGNHLLALLS